MAIMRDITRRWSAIGVVASVLLIAPGTGRADAAGAGETRGPRHDLYAWGCSAGSQSGWSRRLRQRTHRARREAERGGRFSSGRCGRSLRLRNDGDEPAIVIRPGSRLQCGRHHVVHHRLRWRPANGSDAAGGDEDASSRRRHGRRDDSARRTGGAGARCGRGRHHGRRGTAGGSPAAGMGSQRSDALTACRRGEDRAERRRHHRDERLDPSRCRASGRERDPGHRCVSRRAEQRRRDKSGCGTATIDASRWNGEQDQAAAVISWCGLRSPRSGCVRLDPDRCPTASHRRPHARPGSASPRIGREGEGDAGESVHERRPAGRL